MKLFNLSQTKKRLAMAIFLSVSTPTLANAETPTTSATTIDGVIALVNDTAILNSQLEQATAETVQRLKAQQQALPPDNVLFSQVLEQMIVRQIQLDIIKRQGFKIDENQVNNALTGIAKQNNMASLAQLQQQLDSEYKGSYQALRQKITDDLSIQALQQQQVARRVKISEQDIDMFLKSPESQMLNQAQYHTLHLRVPYPISKNLTEKQRQQAVKIAKQIAEQLKSPTADINQIMQQAQASYAPEIQGGDMGFHTATELPLDIANQITQLKVGEVSEPLITPEGVNVVKLVEKRDDGQQVIDQWQTRHILISASATLSNDMAKQQIESLYRQLQQGEDFATLASTYSKDTGSATNGGLLGWVSEGEMVPEFENMMKNTEVNDFSVPFQSQFGWHILKVDSKRKHDVTELYRRNVAKEVLYKRLAPQALEDWLQELKAQSYIKINQ